MDTSKTLRNGLLLEDVKFHIKALIVSELQKRITQRYMHENDKKLQTSLI